ncbi:MAG: aminoglycoside 6'-N-acetyltransferase [Pseudomonadota bacterium]
MNIAPCTANDLEDWVALRVALWPDYVADELREGAAAMLDAPGMLALLCRSDDGEAAGFAEASIRRDYVNGCETSPVAFLEGIYVTPAHRHHHVARRLCDAVADWGRSLGCTEFASDALLDNAGSHAFHAAIGFEETERVVYFRRPL